MSNLPRYRRLSVKPVAFKATGVDFFGPFEIYSQINTAMKACCCLFTCLTIRAVHIEVTSNLQNETCIMAFQRFFSRRGLPKRIHSDNALYFTSTEKTFEEKQLHNYRLQRYRNIRNRKRLQGSLFYQEHHILVNHGNASLG